MKMPTAFATLALTTLALGWPATTSAQVIAHPNQIVGRIELSNTSPEMLALLERAPGENRGFDRVSVTARSQPPQAPTLEHKTSPAIDRLGGNYELTVESGPPGNGIAYDVTPVASTTDRGTYLFRPAISNPIQYEPAPDEVIDYRECAGAFRIHFRTALGQPYPIESASLYAYAETAPGSGVFGAVPQASKFRAQEGADYVLVVRGDGSLYRLRVDFQIGSDPYFDLLTSRTERDLTVDCEQIVDVVIQCPPPNGPGGASLGTIIGEVDVIGEEEHLLDNSTRVLAEDGPLGNYRWHHVDRQPSSGSYLLPNIMPSDVVSPPDGYELWAEAVFRRGRRFEIFRTPKLVFDDEVLVGVGATVDLGDTLVIDPGRISGDVRLAGPLLPDSTLADLYRLSDEDIDADGIPDIELSPGLGNGSQVYAEGSFQRAPGARYRALSGLARVIFEGDLDPLTGELRGDYDMILGGLARESSLWEVPVFQYELRDTDTPERPETYHFSIVHVEDRARPDLLVSAGSHDVVPKHYCVSQVNLRFRTRNGTFYRPSLRGEGTFTGLTFEGLDGDHLVDLRHAGGTPARIEDAAEEGLVVLTLVAGRYELQPTIEAVNPGGGTSTVALNPVVLQVGCREVQTGYDDLHLVLDSVPLCVTTGLFRVGGIVNGADPIDLIEQRMDGGPWVEVCANCGVDPVFAFDVSLARGDNTLEVRARSGLLETALTKPVRLEDLAPADLGNVLRAAKERIASGGFGARLDWRDAPATSAAELVRDTAPGFPAPVAVATVPAPVLDALDATPFTPGAPALQFFRVHGRNCAGVLGP